MYVTTSFDHVYALNAQTGANFYKLAYGALVDPTQGVTVPLFRTDDRELSPLSSVTDDVPIFTTTLRLAIVTEVDHFCGTRPQRDDMCLVCLRRLDDSTPLRDDSTCPSMSVIADVPRPKDPEQA